MVAICGVAALSLFGAAVIAVSVVVKSASTQKHRLPPEMEALRQDAAGRR